MWGEGRGGLRGQVAYGFATRGAEKMKERTQILCLFLATKLTRLPLKRGGQQCPPQGGGWDGAEMAFLGRMYAVHSAVTNWKIFSHPQVRVHPVSPEGSAPSIVTNS